MTAAAATTRVRIWTTDPDVIAEERRNEAATTLTASMRGRAPAPCTIRLGKPDDLAFVVDSWVKHAHRNERKRSATAHVRGLIGRAGAALYIAHVPDEPDAILGYALIEGGRPSVLHYVYVRSSARRLGVASTLLSGVVDKVIEYSAQAPRHWPQTTDERRLGCAPVLVMLPSRWVENLSRGNT